MADPVHVLTRDSIEALRNSFLSPPTHLEGEQPLNYVDFLENCFSSLLSVNIKFYDSKTSNSPPEVKPHYKDINSVVFTVSDVAFPKGQTPDNNSLKSCVHSYYINNQPGQEQLANALWKSKLESIKNKIERDKRKAEFVKRVLNYTEGSNEIIDLRKYADLVITMVVSPYFHKDGEINLMIMNIVIIVNGILYNFDRHDLVKLALSIDKKKAKISDPSLFFYSVLKWDKKSNALPVTLKDVYFHFRVFFQALIMNPWLLSKYNTRFANQDEFMTEEFVGSVLSELLLIDLPLCSPFLVPSNPFNVKHRFFTADRTANTVPKQGFPECKEGQSIVTLYDAPYNYCRFLYFMLDISAGRSTLSYLEECNNGLLKGQKDSTNDQILGGNTHNTKSHQYLGIFFMVGLCLLIGVVIYVIMKILVFK